MKVKPLLWDGQGFFNCCPVLPCLVLCCPCSSIRAGSHVWCHICLQNTSEHWQHFQIPCPRAEALPPSRTHSGQPGHRGHLSGPRDYFFGVIRSALSHRGSSGPLERARLESRSGSSVREEDSELLINMRTNGADLLQDDFGIYEFCM